MGLEPSSATWMPAALPPGQVPCHIKDTVHSKSLPQNNTSCFFGSFCIYASFCGFTAPKMCSQPHFPHHTQYTLPQTTLSSL